MGKQAVVDKTSGNFADDEVYVTQRWMEHESVMEDAKVKPEHILQWGPYSLVKVVLDIKGCPDRACFFGRKRGNDADKVERLYILAGDGVPTLPMSEREKRSDAIERENYYKQDWDMSEEGLFDSLASTAASTPPRLSPRVPGLPDGWNQYFAPDGRAYYHNPVTAVTQWHHPSSRETGCWMADTTARLGLKLSSLCEKLRQGRQRRSALMRT